jgi:hypothetical protein
MDDLIDYSDILTFTMPNIEMSYGSAYIKNG